MKSISPPNSPDTSTGAAAEFPQTHWSVVLIAGRTDSPRCHEALTKLCSAYWYPLYAFVRRRGHAPPEAEDLTQEFYARLLDKRYLEGITEEGGRFRSYLLTMLKHFLANEWHKGQAQKRGGQMIIISVDFQAAEDRYRYEPVDQSTPETLFERRWASTLLEKVLTDLQSEYADRHRSPLFKALRGCLSGDVAQIPYAKIGGDFGMSEGAVKVAVHRLRKRYGELVRAEIATTVTKAEDIDEEIRHLIALL